MLALTKVDWNNNTLYKTLPVTLVYSQIFANVVKQSPDIVDEVYDYRFLCSRFCPQQADTKRLALHSATAVDAGSGFRR
jgi:hypothetical protein